MIMMFSDVENVKLFSFGAIRWKKRTRKWKRTKGGMEKVKE
jgi:hypothetical protein